ncbi:UbiA family prenyltransferase [Streptomyces sp. CA-250714]|uniref:UbiA family prenyltransferase n=1 Tax=Streptomyces sp. CA-250714 TaxID=3240060 RepID=UPI003D8B9E1B
MTGGRAAAWAQLLRVSAVSTVPGDALVGAVVTGRGPGRGTALAAGASLCLYEAGMALNDWADREEDARERPERPLPSGRISPSAALAAATGLTVTGLALAARAGRLPLATATALAGTVWAYDLKLKHTPAGPAAMAAARSLDVLLGATATTAHGARSRPAAASSARGVASSGRGAVPVLGAAATAAHRAPGRPASASSASGAASFVRAFASFVRGAASSVGVSASSAHGATSSARGAVPVLGAAATAAHRAPGRPASASSARGAASSTPAAASSARSAAMSARAAAPALSAAALMGAHTLAVTAVSRREAEGGAPGVPLVALGGVGAIAGLLVRRRTPLTVAACAAYAGTASRPLVHAALNPSPPLLQRAVGGGIRAMIPLQAALAARASSPAAGDDAARNERNRAAGSVSALALLGLLPVARRLSRKVSPT